MKVSLVKMNKELLKKLNALTNLIIDVQSSAITQQQQPSIIAVRRGNPREARAAKNAKLKNQVTNLFK